jgi:hypothetical protein
MYTLDQQGTKYKKLDQSQAVTKQTAKQKQRPNSPTINQQQHENTKRKNAAVKTNRTAGNNRNHKGYTHGTTLKPKLSAAAATP